MTGQTCRRRNQMQVSKFLDVNAQVHYRIQDSPLENVSTLSELSNPVPYHVASSLLSVLEQRISPGAEDMRLSATVKTRIPESDPLRRMLTIELGGPVMARRAAAIPSDRLVRHQSQKKLLQVLIASLEVVRILTSPERGDSDETTSFDWQGNAGEPKVSRSP